MLGSIARRVHALSLNVPCVVWRAEEEEGRTLTYPHPQEIVKAQPEAVICMMGAEALVKEAGEVGEAGAERGAVVSQEVVGVEDLGSTGLTDICDATG